MKPLGLDYFKTIKFEGKEAIITDVKYDGDGSYTLTCEDLSKLSIKGFIETHKKLHYDLEYQKMENKKLRRAITEYSNSVSNKIEELKQYLPRE